METPLAQAISIQQQILLVDYTSIPAYVLLYYDYLLTIGDEAQFFWAIKRITFTTVLFYLNRYISLLGHVPIVFGRHFLSLSSNTTQTCRYLVKYHQYLTGVIQTIAGLYMGCRIYALYDRRRWIIYLLGTAGLAVIGFGIWTLHDMSLGKEIQQELIPVGCLIPLTKRDASRYAAAWSGALAFDAIVFTMTAYKSLARDWEQDGALLRVLLRDGTIYFGTMVLLTVSVILSFHLSLDYDRGITASLTNVLSSIMISRLMLNLRDPNYVTRPFHPRTLTKLVDTSFSNDDLSECISNGDVLLQQVDGTRSQVMLLHPRGRTPSDATDATFVPSVQEEEEEFQGLMQDPNKYQKHILESF